MLSFQLGLVSSRHGDELRALLQPGSRNLVACGMMASSRPPSLIALGCATFRRRIIMHMPVRAEHEFEHGRPAGAVNIPAFFSTAMGMQVNPEFVGQASNHFVLPP